MTVDIYAPTAHDTLSAEELALYHLIMDYRASVGLDPIPLSSALTTTAGRHALDSVENIWGADLVLPDGANLHSWSDAPYYADHRQPDVMWFAPDRLGTGFGGYGFEISAAGFSSIEDVLTGWQGSPGHDNVIVNAEGWASSTWQSIGIGVTIQNDPSQDYWGNVFHVWFSETADLAPKIVGTGAADTMVGTDWGDRIRGQGGNDRIDAGKGSDEVWGNNGRDKVWLGSGHDTFTDNDQAGKAGADTVRGEAGRDTLIGGGGNDRFYGNGQDDQVSGGAGNDTLRGGSDDDKVTGGKGKDVISGDKDADVLRGGGGRDTFVFRNGDGDDVIRDYVDGTDQLRFLPGAGDVDIAASGADTLLRYSGGTILLVGVDASDITTTDFLFG